MEFDFAEVLLQVMERNASDLHLTAGSPPMIRHHGRLHALDYPRLTPQTTREVDLLDPHERPAPEAGDRLADRPRLLDPGQGALPRQRVLPARRDVRGLPPDPARDAEARLASGCRRCSRTSRRSRAASCSSPGPTGSGKSTSLAAMLDLINETRHEHILSIEDPIEFLHKHKKCIVNQRELGADAQSFALGLKARAAPGPRRDPRRRDARPRDDLDRADRGRDRPPRVRDAAHAGHGADGRPHRRRVPARAAAAGARPAVGRAAGHRDPAAAARRPTARAAAAPPRCWCRPRRCAT